MSCVCNMSGITRWFSCRVSATCLALPDDFHFLYLQYVWYYHKIFMSCVCRMSGINRWLSFPVSAKYLVLPDNYHVLPLQHVWYYKIIIMSCVCNMSGKSGITRWLSYPAYLFPPLCESSGYPGVGLGRRSEGGYLTQNTLYKLPRAPAWPPTWTWRGSLRCWWRRRPVERRSDSADRLRAEPRPNTDILRSKYRNTKCLTFLAAINQL